MLLSVALNMLPVIDGMSRLVPVVARPVLAPVNGVGADRGHASRR